MSFPAGFVKKSRDTWDEETSQKNNTKGQGFVFVQITGKLICRRISCLLGSVCGRIYSLTGFDQVKWPAWTHICPL